MAKLAAPSGFRDLLPDQYRKRAELIRRIRHTYESFGFEGMDTPAVESLAVLLGKGGGENEKLMFRVLKRGAELERARAGGGELADLALRFDLTVPLARYYATHRAALPPCSSATRSARCGAPSARNAALPRVRAVRRRRARLGVDGVRRRSSWPPRPPSAISASTASSCANSRPLLARLVHSCGVADDHLGAAVVAIDKLDKTDAGTIRGGAGGEGRAGRGGGGCSICTPARARPTVRRCCARSERVGAAGAASVAETPRGAGAHTTAASGASPSIPSSPAASTTTPAPSSRSPPPACPQPRWRRPLDSSSSASPAPASRRAASRSASSASTR